MMVVQTTTTKKTTEKRKKNYRNAAAAANKYKNPIPISSSKCTTIYQFRKKNLHCSINQEFNRTNHPLNQMLLVINKTITKKKKLTENSDRMKKEGQTIESNRREKGEGVGWSGMKHKG